MQSDEKRSILPSLLIVEDDQQAGEILGIVIRRKYPAITLYSADNGKNGVKLFQAHAPQIVITDINMPEMDGIEMARQIKSIKSSTRFIVVTAYSNTSYLDKFSDIGFSEYLLKPIEFTKLFSALEKCIEETKLEQQ